MEREIEIAPSILAADFARLGEQVKEAEAAGADRIHIDVMDGMFVPNITMGPVVVKALRKVTDLPLDVHLMIERPERYLEAFAEAGADIITVHVEASVHLHRTLTEIHRLGLKAGVALNPHTPPEMVREVIEYVDVILAMTVNPGFSGQSFIHSTLPKIGELRRMLNACCGGRDLAVDGGIDPATAVLAISRGANVLVAGDAIFRRSVGIARAIQELRGAQRIAARQTA